MSVFITVYNSVLDLKSVGKYISFYHITCISVQHCSFWGKISQYAISNSLQNKQLFVLSVWHFPDVLLPCIFCGALDLCMWEGIWFQDKHISKEILW